jgi:myo-inositol-1(or 4)-monophosphatase
MGIGAHSGTLVAGQMNSSDQLESLRRIHSALESARAVFGRFTPDAIATEYKAGHDPVTEVDRQIDAVLREKLVRDGEGWLSEESIDDTSRLQKDRVWVVDPLDGTREFLTGVSEFCISVAMVEHGRPVAGGICNPARDEIFLGSLDRGVTCNGERVRPRPTTTLRHAVILASRSEVTRGEWKAFEKLGFEIRPMGSVAYKLACVSAGRADATFTLNPKHEWDVAGGAALVESAGGFVTTLDNTALRCNNKNPRICGLIAGARSLREELWALLSNQLGPELTSAPSRNLP